MSGSFQPLDPHLHWYELFSLTSDFDYYVRFSKFQQENKLEQRKGVVGEVVSIPTRQPFMCRWGSTVTPSGNTKSESVTILAFLIT